jgi:dihydroxyacid dehydratase/phosphogluconate dehydratase
LALVRDGDMIEVDVPARRLHLDVSDEELEERRLSYVPQPPPVLSGYQYLYTNHVLQADEGCDFDFALRSGPLAVPRESH